MTNIQSKNIKKLLKIKKITQLQLSKLTNIPKSTINDYVTGKRSISKKNIEKITQALQVSSIDLNTNLNEIVALKNNIVKEDSEIYSRFIAMTHFQLFKLQKEDIVLAGKFKVGEQILMIQMPYYNENDIVVSIKENSVIIALSKNCCVSDIVGKIIGTMTLEL